MICFCQAAVPLMLARLVPPTFKASELKTGPEICHQKLSVPGPVTVVWSVDCWPGATAVLWTAATPSWVTAVSLIQGVMPVEVKTRLVAFNTWARLVRLTRDKMAFELVRTP